MFRFRLSTTLLLVLSVSLFIAWQVDRTRLMNQFAAKLSRQEQEILARHQGWRGQAMYTAKMNAALLKDYWDAVNSNDIDCYERDEVLDVAMSNLTNMLPELPTPPTAAELKRSIKEVQDRLKERRERWNDSL